MTKQTEHDGACAEAAPVYLTDEQVSRFLLENPDFFIRNALQVEQMRVPHPVRGSVSLVEWQLSRQRHHIQQLEEEITQLMEQGAANGLLFTQLVDLFSELVLADSLQALLTRLNKWTRSLGLTDATLRLFSDKWRLTAPSGFTDLAISRSAFEPLRIQRLRNENHYLGPLNGPEILLLMPEAKMVGSVALTLLGKYGDSGMVIFTSRDPQHYQRDMGTLFLAQLGLFLPCLLSRWIEPL